MDSQARVGLVGIAGYGGSYLKALLQDSRAASVQFVAAADPNYARCERLGELQKRGVAIFSSANEMFAAAKLDLAIICTPIHFHAEQVRAALQSGAHVLCEKPLAGSLRDAMQMQRDAQAHNRIVAVGFQWSFTSAIQSLKRDIRSGALGKPLRLRSYVVYPRGFKYYSRNSWAGRIRSESGAAVLDSPVNNATAHFLHNMFFILGESPARSQMPVSVQAELYRANAIENYDTAVLRCAMPDGAEVMFHTSHCIPSRVGPRCLFECENAVVSNEAAVEGEFVATFRDGRTRVYGDPNREQGGKLWQTLDAMRTGGRVLCDVESALPHTLATLAAQQSSRIVTFPENLLGEQVGDEGPMIVVDGLGEVMNQSFERGLLPSELGIAHWAEAGKPVSIEELHQQD